MKVITAYLLGMILMCLPVLIISKVASDGVIYLVFIYALMGMFWFAGKIVKFVFWNFLDEKDEYNIDNN